MNWLRENLSGFWSLPILLSLGLSFYLFYLKKTAQENLWGQAEITADSKLLPLSLYDILTFSLTLFLGLLCLRFVFAVNEKIKREKRLAQELESKGEVLSFASHELYSPTTNIRNTLSVILPELRPDYQKFAERALNSTDHLVKLIDTILTISRFEMGKVKLDIQKSQIEKLCQEVVNEFRPAAEGADLKLNFEAPVEAVAAFEFDPSRVREVLANLISNAIKYTHTGRIEVKLESRGDEVTVSVRDTGIGVAAEDLGNLFNRFFRTETAENTQRGTGLGLYISRLIVEAHHGKIWVESQLNKGSTFSFSLPMK